MEQWYYFDTGMRAFDPVISQYWRSYNGAGSGMTGRAAAIPIWNLVWRRRTNPRCS